MLRLAEDGNGGVESQEGGHLFSGTAGMKGDTEADCRAVESVLSKSSVGTEGEEFP